MRRTGEHRPIHRAGHPAPRVHFGQHMLLSLDDWYAWLPGRSRPVLSTYGYEPRHAAPEEDS